MACESVARPSRLLLFWRTMYKYVFTIIAVLVGATVVFAGPHHSGGHTAPSHSQPSHHSTPGFGSYHALNHAGWHQKGKIWVAPRIYWGNPYGRYGWYYNNHWYRCRWVWYNSCWYYGYDLGGCWYSCPTDWYYNTCPQPPAE